MERVSGDLREPGGSKRIPAALPWVALLLVGAGPDGPWPEGPVEILRSYQPTLHRVVRDGRVAPLRLVGIDAVDRHDGALLVDALEAVRGWLADEPVRLVHPRPNARGEIEGDLRFPDSTTLRERLVARGWALLDPPRPEAAGFDRLQLAQQAARQRRRGVWAAGRLRAEDALRARGRIARVCGNAANIMRDPEGVWQLVLGRSYVRRDVTLRIAPERQAAFGDPQERFLRHDLCVTGRVAVGATGPEIVLVDPTQLEDRGGLRAR